MTLISLICPHCSENFELNSESLQQSFWVCPSCGNRSLLQKTNDSIRLRGIIATNPNAAHANLPPVIIQSATALPESPEQSSDQDIPVEPNDYSSTDRVIQDTNSSEAVRQFLKGSQPATVIIEQAAPESAVEQVTEQAPKVEPTQLTEPQIAAATIETPPAANNVRPISLPQQPEVNEIDHLCKLAEDAAGRHDLPLFNVYSRQALDCQPRDARIYALRASLIEEADGFARATWDSLGWTLLTPRRKQSIIAQNLFNFNTTIKYGGVNKHQEFIHTFARQLVRQAIDVFTEQAELRCRKRIFHKTFKGRYKAKDFKAADKFIETVSYINQQTCPIAFFELTSAIRGEIAQSASRIARRLRKV